MANFILILIKQTNLEKKIKSNSKMPNLDDAIMFHNECNTLN